jgi:hypothetical protein
MLGRWALSLLRNKKPDQFHETSGNDLPAQLDTDEIEHPARRGRPWAYWHSVVGIKAHLGRWNYMMGKL